jgi:hypothetical protein
MEKRTQVPFLELASSLLAHIRCNVAVWVIDVEEAEGRVRRRSGLRRQLGYLQVLEFAWKNVFCMH